ncbi:odorant receptor 4-like [Nylanderia fulva]|nr:odorant receptor 4-like [Nylanderia fulva]
MCGAGFMLLAIWLYFFQNKSQSHQRVQIATEYFVDEEKYVYLILLHISVAICIGITAALGGGQLVMAVVVYLCGLFRITSYRIEKAMSIRVFENTHLEKRTMIYKEIIDAVKIHRQAIKFSKFLSSHFKGTLLYTTLITVISLSLNIFGIFRNALFEKKETFVMHFGFVIGLLTLMFLMNYIGQEIIDHSNDVYSMIYSSQWYTAPLHAQKLLFFMLQRSSKSVEINVSGLFVVSLECFATLVKSSMSYFAVMYSIQE